MNPQERERERERDDRTVSSLSSEHRSNGGQSAFRECLQRTGSCQWSWSWLLRCFTCLGPTPLPVGTDSPKDRNNRNSSSQEKLKERLKISYFTNRFRDPRVQRRFNCFLATLYSPSLQLFLIILPCSVFVLVELYQSITAFQRDKLSRGPLAALILVASFYFLSAFRYMHFLRKLSLIASSVVIGEAATFEHPSDIGTDQADGDDGTDLRNLMRQTDSDVLYAKEQLTAADQLSSSTLLWSSLFYASFLIWLGIFSILTVSIIDSCNFFCFNNSHPVIYYLQVGLCPIIVVVMLPTPFVPALLAELISKLLYLVLLTSTDFYRASISNTIAVSSIGFAIAVAMQWIIFRRYVRVFIAQEMRLFTVVSLQRHLLLTQVGLSNNLNFFAASSSLLEDLQAVYDRRLQELQFSPVTLRFQDPTIHNQFLRMNIFQYEAYLIFFVIYVYTAIRTLLTLLPTFTIGPRELTINVIWSCVLICLPFISNWFAIRYFCQALDISNRLLWLEDGLLKMEETDKSPPNEHANDDGTQIAGDANLGESPAVDIMSTVPADTRGMTPGRKPNDTSIASLEDDGEATPIPKLEDKMQCYTAISLKEKDSQSSAQRRMDYALAVSLIVQLVAGFAELCLYRYFLTLPSCLHNCVNNLEVIGMAYLWLLVTAYAIVCPVSWELVAPLEVLSKISLLILLLDAGALSNPLAAANLQTIALTLTLAFMTAASCWTILRLNRLVFVHQDLLANTVVEHEKQEMSRNFIWHLV